MNEFQENDSFVVKIEKGENLMAADINGFSDPYCKVTLNDKFEKRTQIKKKTLNPQWNEIITFYCINTKKSILKIKIDVYDWDLITDDDFIGSYTLMLEIHDLTPGVEYPKELPLQGAKSGTVHIKYKWVKGGNSHHHERSTTTTPPPFASYKYRPHISHSISAPSLEDQSHVTTDHSLHSSKSLRSHSHQEYQYEESPFDNEISHDTFKIISVFGSHFAPQVPSEFVLVGSNRDEENGVFVASLFGSVSKNILSITYNRMHKDENNKNFMHEAEEFISNFFKNLKREAEACEDGIYSLKSKAVDITHEYDGEGKYNRVLQTQCKSTVKQKTMHVICLTCNMSDHVMLNYVLFSPNQEQFQENARMKVLFDIASNTTAN